MPSYCECSDDLLSLVGDANAIDALPLGIGLEVEVGCEHLEILRFLRLAENQMQLGVSKVFTDLLGPFGYNGSLILNVSHQLCPFLMPYPLGIFGNGFRGGPFQAELLDVSWHRNVVSFIRWNRYE